MKNAALGLAALALLCACTRPEAPYRTEMPLKEVMGHVIDPAADMVWGASGYVITEEGEQDLSPTDEAGWLNVENGATIVAESANLLMLPGRALDDREWMQYAARMADEAMVAKAAAEAQDKDKLFEAGAALYQSCVACHEKYSPELSRGRALPTGG